MYNSVPPCAFTSDRARPTGAATVSRNTTMYCSGITPVAPVRGPGCVGVKASRHAPATRRTLSATALAHDMITTWGVDEYRSHSQVPFPAGYAAIKVAGL